MSKRTKLVSLLVGTSLVMANIPVAAATGQTFEVTAQSTVADIQAAIGNPDYDLVKFVEDANFTQGIVINRAVDLEVEDGVTLNFNLASGTGLTFQKSSTFTNNGVVNLSSGSGYGIQIKNSPGDIVTFVGDGRDDSSINIGPTSGYGVDGQFMQGSLVMQGTTLDIAPGSAAREGAMIFTSFSGNSVHFEDSNVTLAHTNPDSAERAALQSTVPVTFRDSVLVSDTAKDYNLSVYNGCSSPTDCNVSLNFERSDVELTTLENAKSAGFWIFSKPFVSINTANSTVNITDSSVKSTLLPKGRLKRSYQDFQFQDALYNISNSTVIGGSFGEDDKKSGNSSLNISGDSLVSVPGFSSDASDNAGNINNAIDTIIDGGNNRLPAGLRARNSKGQELTEFVSTGSTTDGLGMNCSADSYWYEVSTENTDGKKHVWAPKVTVEYYESETSPTVLATKNMIAGSIVEETLNSSETDEKADGTPVPIPDTAPTGFENEFYIFDPVTPEPSTFIQSGDDATAVCQNTKVALRVKALDIIPIMDVDTEDLTVNVGHVFDPAEGLLNVPDGATVEVISEADTSKPDQVTRTVKVTFKDGSSVVKVINVTVIGDDPVDPPTDPTGSSTGEIVGLVIGIISAIILLINIPAIINFFQSLFQVPEPAPAPEKPMKPGTPKGKGILKPGLAK
ncbi:Rib/alpha-like domain-containing protein [Corynebacterium sp. ES2794-CONJ1]|uniref:Rib/alpha-like domain-containing protein n=1 Tax=unclassified Corynebacterium TaxID=2624378 RepID=UPI002168324C|nr:MULTISPECIES: Rib/alpha-like domain-containing protein [unclassified Corynebacterium]MCS4491879.1 Rib/alpha-like domain-containing protein [Corynebacterium sp. ES2715-CONJ3]MCU9519385.1 Rib/alpha-like domain-containing protein [Corynebacterium sp. ES2794-CONJ1]